MARAALTAVTEAAEEPILVEWEQDGEARREVIEQDDPRWIVAWLYREQVAHTQNAERELRSKRAQITKLQREKSRADEAERRAHPDRTFIEDLFEMWAEGIGKSRCKLTPERFDMAVARLAEKYEREHLLEAVWALILNPWVIKGDAKRDWKTALKTGESVEAHANRCPSEKRREIRGTLFEAVAA